MTESSPGNGAALRKRFIGSLFLLIVPILLFGILYWFRAYDDSRLASWPDVYRSIDPLRTLLAIIIAQVIAFLVSSYELPERYQPFFLFALSFCLTVPFWSEPEMIVDASRYFGYAKYTENEGVIQFLRDWGGPVDIWTDMPLVPLLYGILFEVFGELRVIVQVFNSGLFAGSVLLTYSIGRELFDRETGFNAALLLPGVPYLFTQVPLMLVDLPSLFFLMLSVYLFLFALRRGGLYVVTASVSIVAAFFTKYSTWLMMTILPVIYAAELFRNRKSGIDRYALRGMIAFFISFFLISLLIALKHDEMLKQIHLLISYQKPGLQRWGESLVSTWLFQVHPFVTILALLSVYFAVRKRDLSYLVVAWLVFVVLALQVRRIRYIVMVFPMLAMMASYGLMHFRQKVNVRAISLSVLAFSFAIASSGFLPFMEKTSAVNFKYAGKYLDSLDIDSVEVFTPLPGEYHLDPAVYVPVLDIFTKNRIVYHYDPSEYPLPEDLATSRLRFTWEYKNPGYYQGDISGRRAVVVISDRKEIGTIAPINKAIAGLPNRIDFPVRDDVFATQTLITVYH